MLAIIAATKDELKYFLRHTGINDREVVNGVQLIRLTCSGTSMVLAISGVGMKRARTAAKVLTGKFNISLIISVGFCGSLKKQLTTGDAVLASWVERSGSIGKYILYEDVIESLSYLNKGGILTSRRFINRSKQKKALAGETNASCVDMETWSIAKSAEDSGIPVMALRVITDGFNTDLPEMEKLFTRKQRISLIRAMKYFIRNPHLLLPFLKFKYFDIDNASRSLNDSLVKTLNALPEEFSN